VVSRNQPIWASFSDVRSVPAGEVSLKSHATIFDALRLLDQTACQIVLVVSDDGRLVGVATDGDLRRALLGGSNLESPVAAAVNRDFHSVRSGYESSVTVPLLEARGIRQVPVVDENGCPVELLILGSMSPSPGRPNRVVIMAGGRGLRLRPLTDHRPKPLLAIGGVPILELIIRNYASQGFRRFTIVVGYLSEQIERYFQNGSKFGVSIEYLREEQPMGTAGSLKQISEDGGPSIVVSNADVLTSLDLGAMVDSHESSGCSLTIAVRREEISISYGVITRDDHTVISWQEKPKISFEVSAGVYVLDPAAISVLDGGPSDFPDLVAKLLEDGKPVGSFEFDGLWMDVGTHDNFLAAVTLAGFPGDTGDVER